MTFVCPLPPVKVKVRAEYLYDHQHGHGDFVDGVWVSVKSIRGEAFRFETYLPEYAALYDKLPIDAFIQERKQNNYNGDCKDDETSNKRKDQNNNIYSKYYQHNVLR